MQYQVTVRAVGVPLSPEETDELVPYWAKRMFELELSISEIMVTELDTGREATLTVEAPSAGDALRIAERTLHAYYDENPDLAKLVQGKLVRREWRVETMSNVAV